MPQYSIVSDGENTNITVYISGHPYPLVADDSHPNYAEIKDVVVFDLAEGDDEYLIGLFDVAATAAKYFAPLSERVSVANGRLYFDNDEVDNSLAKQVVRFINEGVSDWQPLVKFMENVANNPHPHSREQLYDWLAKRDFTITDEGYIVAYKGVQVSENGGYESIHSGKAIVDGEVVSGRIPTNPGSIVEMPRLEVHHDPSTGCSTGLHAGNWRYARSFANIVLEVRINPRDVVSVPTDSDWEKVRVCRYEVIQVVDAAYDTSVLFSDSEDLPTDEEVYEYLFGDDEDDTEEIEDNEVIAGYPTKAEWEALEARVKSRKQSHVKLAQAQGWRLINDDEPKSRTSWTV
jgi:hypothetical protein